MFEASLLLFQILAIIAIINWRGIQLSQLIFETLEPM